MPPVLGFIDPTLRALDDHVSDILVLSAFSDEQPLEGITGLVDWRLRGRLSSWFVNGFATGRWGERVLYPVGKLLTHPALLIFGLGGRAEHRADRALAVAKAAAEAATGLNSKTLTCSLFGLADLPTPFERTGAQLISLLMGFDAFERITLVATSEQREILKECLELVVRSNA